MSTTSNRNVTVQFSGDITLNQPVAASVNTSSPGSAQEVALANGANTITPPAGATGCTIQKPAGNAVTLTLKGVTGDTGVPLHLTDPDSISLAGSSSFVLTAGAAVSVRLYWT